MSLPEPPISLDGSCSVVYNDVLYSFSPNGFVSIELGGGGKWTKMEMGEKVTGATCTGTTPADASEAAFFVVGGTADSQDYPGLQKFTYSTGKWTTLHPSDLVAKNRIGHGAIYIEKYDVILVYAGSQDSSSGLSSQTFTINASEPYGVLSYESDAPVSLPILMNWSAEDAAIMSGDGTSGEIYWFNPVDKWRHSGASLARPVDKADGWMDAVLTDGTDGSKSIYTFDLSQSPNLVHRAIVQDASGKPVANAVAVAKRGVADKASLGPRDLTIENWPAYNSTLAPVGIRKGFTVAQSADGLAVISGGTAQEPLEVFDTQQNSWLNATKVFVDGPPRKMEAQEAQQVLASTSTTRTSTRTSASSTSLASSTSMTGTTRTTSLASTTSPATTSHPAFIPSPAITSTPTDLPVPPMNASDSDASGETPNQILGITLGIISGFLFLLGLIAFCLSLRRRRRLKKSSIRNKRIGSPMAIEKDEEAHSMPDRSPPPIYSRSHQHQASQDSASSVAMLLGGAGKNSSKAGPEKPRSASPTVTKDNISKPVIQVQGRPLVQVENESGIISKAAVPGAAAPPARRNPLSAHPPPSAPALPGQGVPGDGTRRSSGWNGYWSSGGTLSILDVGAGASSRDTHISDGPSSRYSEAQSSSHSNPHDSAKVPPLVVHAPRATSKSPVVSTHLSGNPWKNGLIVSIENRPYSAVSSIYSSGVPESVHEAWDPSLASKAWGSDRAPSAAYGLSTKNSLAFPPTKGLSKQPQLAKATTSTDMSWLNLGEDRMH